METILVDHKYAILPLAQLIVNIGGEKSISDARRTISGGGVCVHGQVVLNPTCTVKAIQGLQVKVGSKKTYVIREV